MESPKVKIYQGLRPFSFLYGIGVRLRNTLFDAGILKSQSFPLPVINVGNITVGGTGKTPHTEYLIRLLQQDFNVAVLSRGYKRKSKGFVLATPQSSAEEIGDEPFQMAHKYPEVRIAVDRNRCHGIEQLTSDKAIPPAEVIILDDAFQHRYVKPGLNILLIDYNRPVWDDTLLPAGRLREPLSGKRRADLIIITKCPAQLKEEDQMQIVERLHLQTGQQVFFTRMAYGKLQPLFAYRAERTLDDIQEDEHLLLVTGIASPAPLCKELMRHSRNIHPLCFGDHHQFSAADLSRIEETFRRLPSGKRMIITTEKDAARLINHPSLDSSIKPYIEVLPIEVEFLNGNEKLFNLKIKEYVRKNSRNRSLS